VLPPTIEEVPAANEVCPLQPWEMKCKRIIVGFDFDAGSDMALRVAASLARWLKAEVTIVHSAQLPPTKAQSSQALSDVLSHAMIATESLVVRAIRENGEFAVIPHKTHVGFKSPALLLADVATDENGDLIIVGAHGRHGVGQLLLGSVSESVLQNAPCPVLMIGPTCELQGNALHRILFATSLENTDLRAAQYAGRIAHGRKAHLYLMHVLDKKSPAENRQREWIEANCAEKLTRMLEPSDREKVSSEIVIAYGDPAQEVLAAAVARHVDLLVLGSGEHGALSDHAPWRILTEIVPHARCPILCVGNRAK